MDGGGFTADPLDAYLAARAGCAYEAGADSSNSCHSQAIASAGGVTVYKHGAENYPTTYSQSGSQTVLCNPNGEATAYYLDLSASCSSYNNGSYSSGEASGYFIPSAGAGGGRCDLSIAHIKRTVHKKIQKRSATAKIKPNAS